MSFPAIFVPPVHISMAQIRKIVEGDTILRVYQLRPSFNSKVGYAKLWVIAQVKGVPITLVAEKKLVEDTKWEPTAWDDTQMDILVTNEKSWQYTATEDHMYKTRRSESRKTLWYLGLFEELQVGEYGFEIVQTSYDSYVEEMAPKVWAELMMQKNQRYDLQLKWEMALNEKMASTLEALGFVSGYIDNEAVASAIAEQLTQQ